MAITVGDIYGQFPNFRPEDMIKLCNGNENLNGRTVVPLANIAAFNDNNLSIFAAEKEGKNSLRKALSLLFGNPLPYTADADLRQPCDFFHGGAICKEGKRHFPFCF